MTRWRWIVIALVVLALVLWGALFILNLRPEYGQGVPRADFQLPPSIALQEPLSRLPVWVSSLGLLITLLLAGLANFYLFPVRVRNMRRALTLGWARLIQMVLLGFGFVLLLLGFGIGAVLARVTFPFTVISAVTAFFLSVWGYLCLVYACGRSLLRRTGWQASSPMLSLFLGLLLLLPLVRIPYVGGFFVIFYLSLGLGLVITTHFGSNEPWDLTPLLEEV
jgi:hypothetical protein